MIFMNTDKAYLFGLIIGGGIFGNAEDYLKIRLPYKQWGSYYKHPQRASEISRDIMVLLSPLFRSVYNLNISYETPLSGDWSIICEGDLSELVSDLQSYGIQCEGDLRSNVSIHGIVEALIDDNLKRRFIAGLADTIASTNPNHRRFTNEVQILSFELKGFNFSFVCELCRLLYSINCIPDQILWNHPNFHCTNNPYYRQWNKGFKLRVQVDQYDKFGAVAFKTKAKSLKENRSLQHQVHIATPCPEREIRATKSCIHPAEQDIRLPDCIRGGHFLHNRHVGAVLGCEHAPYRGIKDLLSIAESFITPFPILCKDSIDSIEQIISSDNLLSNRVYRIEKYCVKYLFDIYEANHNALILGNGKDVGYPISEIIQGIAFIIADDNDLKGKRIKGKYKELIEKYLLLNPRLSVEIRIPDLLTPLVIAGNKRGVLIGANNPSVYKSLIYISPCNEYKLCVRAITEKDLRNEK